MKHENIDHDKIRAALEAFGEGDTTLADQLSKEEVDWVIALNKYINGDKDDLSIEES